MNAQPPQLPLRDIHLPPEPSWWPPAPGWWLLAALAIALLAFATWKLVRVLHARARRRALAAEFERAAAIADPLARIAAVSELLRRAARQRDPVAATLAGEAWLGFLDGSDAARTFTTGAGRTLLDAPWRATIDAASADAAVAAARPRYFELVAP